MTSPDERAKKPKLTKADLTRPTRPEGGPGHPAPKPPPDAVQPEAPEPKAPLENVMAERAQTLAPTTAGGKMASTNTAPQPPPQAQGTSPVGMTPRPEEPTEDDDEAPPEAVREKHRGEPPRKR